MGWLLLTVGLPWAMVLLTVKQELDQLVLSTQDLQRMDKLVFVHTGSAACESTSAVHLGSAAHKCCSSAIICCMIREMCCYNCGQRVLLAASSPPGGLTALKADEVTKAASVGWPCLVCCPS